MAEVSTRRPFTITKVERRNGYWTARVTCDGVTVEVDRCFGSWMAQVRTKPGARSFRRCEVLPHVAAALQAKLPQAERKPRARTRREAVAA